MKRSGRLVRAASLGLAIACMAATAGAAVVEPNGLSVPQPPFMGDISLQAFFDGRGETINITLDAAVEPATFWPRCGALEVSFVLKESGAQTGIAWYNLPAGSTEVPTAVYSLLPVGPAGRVANVDIASHPNYAGGAIGFALLKVVNGSPSMPIYYSEYRRNALCSGCTGAGMTPDHWKLALVYASDVTAGAHYLAWEDWEGAGSEPASWFNDGDFNDQVFLVRGAKPCNPTCPTSCDGGGMGGAGGSGAGGQAGSGGGRGGTAGAGRGSGGASAGVGTSGGGQPATGGATTTGGNAGDTGTGDTGGGGTTGGTDATGGSVATGGRGGTTSTGGSDPGEAGDGAGGSAATGQGASLGDDLGDATQSARKVAETSEDSGGCGCRLARSGGTDAVAALLALGVVSAWWRRRRRAV